MVESQERIRPANSISLDDLVVAKVSTMSAVVKNAVDVGAAFARERRAQDVET